jgi:hypothetical protein
VSSSLCLDHDEMSETNAACPTAITLNLDSTDSGSGIQDQGFGIRDSGLGIRD